MSALLSCCGDSDVRGRFYCLADGTIGFRLREKASRSRPVGHDRVNAAGGNIKTEPSVEISAAYAACGIVGCKSTEKQMRPQYPLRARTAPPLATIAANRTLQLTIWAECTGRFRRAREHIREL
jgi:hypothetical protein